MGSNYIVVVFAYNRPDKVDTLLRSIIDYNKFFSRVRVFVDGNKGKDDEKDVSNTEKVVRNYVDKNKNWSYKRRNVNIGLKQNIILGLNETSNIADGFVVLEDDLILSKNFFEWHFKYLHKYKNDSKIWHLSGWNYLNFSSLTQKHAVISPFMNCWGWSTWSDRWKKYNITNAESYTKSALDKGCQSGMYEQYRLNKQGKISTWAIYWYLTIVSNDGLCINSTVPLVLNDGLDGTGVNSGNWSLDQELLDYNNVHPDIDIDVSSLVYTMIKAWYRQNRGIVSKVKRKLRWLLKA